MRPKVLLSLALAAVLLPGVPAAAQTSQQDERAAEQAVRQIEQARAKANAAAAALDKAETAYAQVEDELAKVTADQARAAERLSTLQVDLQDLAVRRYTQGDVASLPLSVSPDDLSAQVRADAMLRLFALGSNDAIDEYRQVSEDLANQDRRLAAAKKRSESTMANLNKARQQLEQQIVKLQKAEEKRQKDAVVRRILEARRAQELERERVAAAAQAAKAAASAPRAAASAGSASSGGGGAARAAAVAAPAVGGMVCPVAGAAAFVDTWGAARSGGRRHEGVDMLGSRGTPIVAVVAGTAQPKNNRLGGNAVWLQGNNGFRYYYAHLDSFGASGAVSAGTVIGYMGDTGNARGTVHLHFEVHPGGGRAVNPTPYVRAAC